ncbi:MAG: SpoIIE family protein phosphatase [Planctomycetes bacterium]|nr:SpoIIE family protein phosphatase [Planctomycetota bacterium]
MKITHRKLNIIFFVCLLAINGAFFIASDRIDSGGTVAYSLPIVACNAAFAVMYAAAKTLAARRSLTLQKSERRYETLHMVSEDQQVEARILETISEVSVEFLEKMQLRPLLERISEAVHDLLGVDISVVEVIPQSGEESVTFVRGASEVALGDEVYNEVVHKGKSLLINNLSRYPQYAKLEQQGVRSVIVAPLMLHGRSIGLIGACTRTHRGFTSRHLRLLYSFAHHSALLVGTTQLLHSVGKLSVKESDSLADLQDLKDRLSYEHALQEREMEVARRIQNDLLPGAMPRIAGLSLEGDSLPAKEVGGDYYDVLDLGEGRWGIAIGDVSGKGVPAALVMVMTRTLLHSLAHYSNSPAEILAAMNSTLYHETDPSVFVSMLYGIWNTHSATFTYSNAGHEPPILETSDGPQSFPAGGVALGAMEKVDDVLTDLSLMLGNGDCLLLYTDGATEARNSQREMFGLERLQHTFEKAAVRNGRVIPTVLRSIRTFAQDAAQHDDITMISMKGTAM